MLAMLGRGTHGACTDIVICGCPLRIHLTISNCLLTPSLFCLTHPETGVARGTKCRCSRLAAPTFACSTRALVSDTPGNSSWPTYGSDNMASTRSPGWHRVISAVLRALMVMSIGEFTSAAGHSCRPDYPLAGSSSSPPSSCRTDLAYISQRLADSPHPTLYKALVSAELVCSQRGVDEFRCASMGDKCSWSRERGGCEAWAAVSGFAEQVAMCSSRETSSLAAAATAIEVERSSDELALEAIIAMECEDHHDSLRCGAAMDGLCEWTAKLGFSQDDSACQSRALPFSQLRTTIRTGDCDATAASQLALVQYRSFFERCVPHDNADACRVSDGHACSWRVGGCRPSVALLLRPLELVGAALADEVTSCESRNPNQDGCDAGEAGTGGRSHPGSDAANHRGVAFACLVVFVNIHHLWIDQ